MKLKSLILFFSILCNTTTAIANNLKLNHFLYEPTGQYGIGFQDFYWINQKVCPDPIFNDKNKADFSSNNKTHCREIIVRITYPTSNKNQPIHPYYAPIIQNLTNFLKNDPNITETQIKQLSLIKSYAVKNANPIKGKFPVLFFSPGSGCPTQLYENIINDLVSHGYIVVGINSPFLSGDIALSNGHIVKADLINNLEKKWGINEALKKSIAIQADDLSYAYQKIKTIQNKNPNSTLFSSMDLQHIGAFGHSMGAKAAADVIRAHPNWFQATALFDIPSYSMHGDTIEKFDIPFMSEISANWQSFLGHPLSFSLGKNNYLVTFSPHKNNRNYAYHMNFSDYSTFQYLPVFQENLNKILVKATGKYNIKFMSHEPSKKDTQSFKDETYVFIKDDKNQWTIFSYYNQEKEQKVNIKGIEGLNTALNALSKKAPEKLLPTDSIAIKKAIDKERISLVGKGNGGEITESINTYTLQFFDTFLKGDVNPDFKNCRPLSTNTQMKCGPGTY